jgi:uncharacterized membrane protein
VSAVALLSPAAVGDRTSRIVLFVSIALNLFFLGVLGAAAVRQAWLPTPVAFEPSRSAAERIDRLVATLSPSDAEKVRAEFRSREASLEAAHSAYRRAQDAMRVALRAEPFDLAALRSAMADVRTARQTLDRALHEVISTAAAEMSAAGRNRLADWSPPHGGAPPK